MRSDLEITVDLGEADFGGILEGSIGLSPALERPHLLTKAQTLTLDSSLDSFLYLSLRKPASLFLSSIGGEASSHRELEEERERESRCFAIVLCVLFCLKLSARESRVLRPQDPLYCSTTHLIISWSCGPMWEVGPFFWRDLDCWWGVLFLGGRKDPETPLSFLLGRVYST